MLPTSGYADLYVRFGSPEASAGFVLTHGTLALTLGGQPAVKTTTYDPAGMRWWRVAPASAGIVGSVSANGLEWTPFATIPMTAPTDVKLDFGAGMASEPAPATVTIRHLDVCPK